LLNEMVAFRLAAWIATWVVAPAAVADEGMLITAPPRTSAPKVLASRFSMKSPLKMGDIATSLWQ
jgi:hypothetical protein